MISNPDRWPQWPLLPVLRGGGQFTEKEYGVIPAVEHDPEAPKDGKLHKLRVYHCLLMMFPKSFDELMRIKYDEYDSPEEAVDAGWYVD